MLEKESSIVDLINRKRSRTGLSELRAASELNSAARSHSRDLAQDKVSPGHTGSDGSTPAQRIRAAGYAWQAVGENVAVGQPQPDQVVEGWENSPTHRAIMLSSEFDEIGVGYHYGVDTKFKHYWTAAFGRRHARA